MNRKWLFVLPNLFTVSSIFCGIFSITRAMEATGPRDFFQAALLILFGAFFDGCDGRVARLTKTQSDFGVQLDSLADVITFGAAPSILLYKWVLHSMGLWGVIVASVYASCGALRLARFNVMAAKETSPSNFFTGLPIPLAAGVVVSIVVAATQAVEPITVTPVPIAIVTLIISYLMVSSIKYHSFKKVKLHTRQIATIGAVLIFGAVIATRVGPNFVLLAYASAYVVVGLIEEVLFGRRRREALQLAANSVAVVQDEDDLVDDDGDDE